MSHDLLGDAVLATAAQEMTDETNHLGPLEFQGPEDYIRGDEGEAVGSGPGYATSYGQLTAKYSGLPSLLGGPGYGTSYGQIAARQAGMPSTMPPSACLAGLDLMGALPQAGSVMGKKMTAQQAGKTGFVVKKSPAGKAVLAHVVNPAKAHDHATSIRNAKATAARAKSLAAKIAAAIQKADKSGARGAVLAHLGDIAKKLGDAGGKLGGAASTHETFISKVKTKQAAGVARTKKAYSPSGTKGKPTILGYGSWDELQPQGFPRSQQQIMVEQVRQGLIGGPGSMSSYGLLASQMAGVPGVRLLGAANWVDIGQMIDPTTGLPMTIDPTTGLPLQPGASGIPGSTDAAAYDGTPGPPGYGMDAPPTLTSVQTGLQAGIDYVQDPNPNGDDQQVYDSTQGDLPLGAIIYDATVMQPLPWQGLGSYTRFFPSSDNSDGKSNSGFQLGGGSAGIMDGWYWWWHGAEAGTEYKHEAAGNALPDGYGSGPQSGPSRSDESIKQGWGPLIGNPSGWTKGLRYDRGKDQWFWYWDQAPSFAQQVGPNGLQARLAQAMLDYNTQLTAAKANYASAVAQDQLNQKQAAQMAQQQQVEDAQAQHQADLAAAQAAAQQPLMESQMQQQALQQQALELQQQQAETQAYSQWLQQPGAMQQPPGGGGGYGGGGYGDGGGGGGDGGDFSDVQDQVPQYADEFGDGQDNADDGSDVMGMLGSHIGRDMIEIDDIFRRAHRR